jgi:hypothetical protein
MKLNAASPFSITPNFFIGIGRSFDLASSLSKMPIYNDSFDIDSISLFNDWKIIGGDILSAVEEIKKAG